MRMQSNPRVAASEAGGFAHQIPRYRKRRTGSKRDTGHGMTGGVMMLFNQALAVRENGRFLFDQRIRGKAAGALAHTHASPARVKSQPHRFYRLDLGVEGTIVGK